MRGHLALTANWERPIAPGPIPKPKKRGLDSKPRKPYVLTKPRYRKVTRDVRQKIYQLALTSMETEAEIRRLFDSCGISKRTRVSQRRRIIEERGL